MHTALNKDSLSLQCDKLLRKFVIVNGTIFAEGLFFLAVRTVVKRTVEVKVFHVASKLVVKGRFFFAVSKIVVKGLFFVAEYKVVVKRYWISLQYKEAGSGDSSVDRAPDS